MVQGLPKDVRERVTSLEAFDLSLFVPTFVDFPDTVTVFTLDPKRKEWTKAEEMSFTDPRVIHIFLEGYSGMFPALEFRAFVQGVATAALIINEKDQVKLALEKLVQVMMEISTETPPRPALPKHLEAPCVSAITDIVNSTEPFNWRRMLSFVYGIFWLAGLTIGTKQTRLQKAAINHLSTMATYYAKLGVLPT